MERALLDTDILSEYLKGFDQNVLTHGDAYARVYGLFTLTSVTVYEIIRGLEEKGAPAQVAKFLAWLEANEVVVPAAEDYVSAARVKAAAKRKGLTVELPDCLIASVASRLDLLLVTGNTDDFQAIRKTGLPLKLADWRSLG